MQARENTDHFWSEKVFGAVYEVKLVHITSLFLCKDSVFLPHFTFICIKFDEMMQKNRVMRQIRWVIITSPFPARRASWHRPWSSRQSRYKASWPGSRSGRSISKQLLRALFCIIGYRFFESMQMVAGPSLTRDIFISAPNSPVPTGLPMARDRRRQNSS